MRPKLLNNPFASCSFVNLDFLIRHIAHLDNKIDLPLLAFKTFGFIFSVSFFYTLSNKIILFLYLYLYIILLSFFAGIELSITFFTFRQSNALF